MRVAAFLVAMVLGSGCASAFDCTGVKLPSSIVICSDPELIRLADQRQQVFNEVRWGIDPQRDKELLADQTGWVRSYATACGVPPNAPPPDPVPPTVKECFKRAAEARIAYIRAYGATGASATVQPAHAAAGATPVLAAPTVSASYRAALSAWIEGHKDYPGNARQRGEEGRAVLRFRVDRAGHVLNYSIVSSTGYADLDATVEAMIRGATLPPFSPDMTIPDIEVSVPINFNLASTAPPPPPAQQPTELKNGSTIAQLLQHAASGQGRLDEIARRLRGAGSIAGYARTIGTLPELDPFTAARRADQSVPLGPPDLNSRCTHGERSPLRAVARDAPRACGGCYGGVRGVHQSAGFARPQIVSPLVSR